MLSGRIKPLRAVALGRRGPLLVLAMLLTTALALAWLWFPRRGAAPGPTLPPHHGVRVMVDPGHGGIDGGTGRPGALEKDINLAVGLELHRILREHGVDAALTRAKDVDLGGEGRGSRWRRDLAARLHLAEEHQAKLMVSLHANASRRATERGPLVFYPAGSEEGRRLASHILTALQGVAEPNFNLPVAARFYVLRQAKATGVLVEMGFLTNPEERQLLLDPSYQRRLAEAVAQGILAYLNEPATP